MPQWKAVFDKDPWSLDTVDAVLAAGAEAVAPQGGVVLWKTTTSTAGLTGKIPAVGRHADATLVARAPAAGWRVLDAWRATKAAQQQLGRPGEFARWKPNTDDLHFYVSR